MAETVEIEQKPWQDQRHFLRQGFKGAEAGVFDRPRRYYPKRTVGRLSQPTRRALLAQMGRARQGSQLNPAAQEQLYNTLQGSYMDGPGMERIKDFVMSGVKPSVESTFATHGRSGSALANEALGKGLARGMTPFIDAERGRMMSASAMAPQLAREDYFDISQMAGAGNMLDQRYQRMLDEDVKRWNFYQDEPYERSRRYKSLIGPPIPGSREQPIQDENSPMQMAGLGIAGLGALSGFF